MWTNYHCHTSFCDGKKPIAEVVSAAREKGMIALGISSHAPLPFDNKWSMRPRKFDKYLAEVDREAGIGKQKRRGLQIYAGLEVDFIPGKISPFDFKDRLDYTIGSVHFVNSVAEDTRRKERIRGGSKPDTAAAINRWEIDNTYDVFMTGLTNLFGGNIRLAVARYYELTREMVNTTPPDIVGHMDKIKMHNRGDQFFMEDEPWYREQVILTLDAIARAGCIVEVNTRGLYQNKTDTTYPSPWVLAEALRKNIPVTLSSDAHHPDDLTNRFPETARQLIDIGFKKIRILLNGRWMDVPFGEDGIITKDLVNNPMA